MWFVIAVTTWTTQKQEKSTRNVSVSKGVLKCVCGKDAAASGYAVVASLSLQGIV